MTALILLIIVLKDKYQEKVLRYALNKHSSSKHCAFVVERMMQLCVTSLLLCYGWFKEIIGILWIERDLPNFK